MRQHIIYVALTAVIGLMLGYHVYLPLLLLLYLLIKFPRQKILLIGICSFFCIYQLQALNSIQKDTQPINSPMMGKIISIKTTQEDRVSFIVNVLGIPLYVTEYNAHDLLPGDIVKITGEAKDATTPTVPHAFNFKSYLTSMGITQTVSAKVVEVMGHQFHIGELQYRVKNYVDATMPAKTASYINALFLGIRSDLDESLVDQVSEMGVIHLFAISGLHVALLTSILSYVLKRLGVIQEITQMILIGFLLGFMILTGGSASVVRASLMMVGFILNKQQKLGFSTLDIFSIVFLLNVLKNPLQVTQLGFIYSYALTLMLICSQSVIKEMNQIKAGLFIPFLAQLSSLPIQIFFYYELNLVSYLANLLVVPLFSFILIPLLLVVMIVPPLAPLSDYLFQLFENVMTGVASMLTYKLTYGALSFLILFALIGILLTGCYRYERYKKRTTWLLTLMSLLLTLELNRYIKPFGILTMLDVGQGDSFVIQSPYQSCQMIVDTGGVVSFGKPGKSIFENTLKPYLLGEGVRQIDFLMLTHGHFDHVGEAIYLLEAFDVTHLVISKMVPNEVMQPVIEKALAQGTKILEVEKGDVISCGSAELTFYSPSHQISDVNDQSLVFKLELGQLSALFTGDISDTVEKQLQEELKGQRFDVYKVAHHGSATSNSDSFVKLLDPAIGLVSSGRRNLYGHPSARVVDLFQSLDIPLLNTQDNGSVQVKVTNRGYDLQIMKQTEY